LTRTRAAGGDPIAVTPKAAKLAIAKDIKTLKAIHWVADDFRTRFGPDQSERRDQWERPTCPNSLSLFIRIGISRRC
jgi:hypothetical protein